MGKHDWGYQCKLVHVESWWHVRCVGRFTMAIAYWRLKWALPKSTNKLPRNSNKVQRPKIKNLFQINLLKPKPLCFVTHKTFPSCSFQVANNSERFASAWWQWLNGDKNPPIIQITKKTPTNPNPTMARKKYKRKKAKRNSLSPSPWSLMGSRWVRMPSSWGVLIWELGCYDVKRCFISDTVLFCSADLAKKKKR